LARSVWQKSGQKGVGLATTVACRKIRGFQMEAGNNQILHAISV